MYTRNVDTGKWFNQIDSLPKDIYDGLREDFDKVRLYSKCLSGATYLPIKSFDDIYDTLSIKKVGYYINDQYCIPDYPQYGPLISLDASSSDEFYNKYLTENAFTIKNLFTPNKLINDQFSNYLYVDVATIFSIRDLNETLPGLVIDGVKLKEGHLVLVKDQVSEVNLAINVDPEVYFTTVQLTATYSQTSLINTPLFPGSVAAPPLISGNLFTYFNSENGIYEYRDSKLVRIDLLDDYDNCYKYSITVGLGDSNREKQFHLMRLRNGYYPVTGQNMAFEEAHNWILRNRVDYNNILDLNFYDILHHGAQEVYYDIEGKTYSIPARTIAVGEFGAIINNQDLLSANATYSVSNIINNKFKVNLRSICQVDNYYWICGEESTILRVSKKDYSIRRVVLDERVDFTSISFWGNLDGFIVGKFNTVYWTSNGGFDWEKITIPEFEAYSYNKVIHISQNKVFIGGDSGVFIEMIYTSGSWISYKRKISKLLAEDDEYLLVDDINDLSKTNWVSIYGTFSLLELSASFRDSLIFEWKLLSGMRLEVSITSKYFDNPIFETSEFYIATNILNIYNNPYHNSTTFPQVPYTNYDLYKRGTDKKYSFTVNLPSSAINPNTGNLYNNSYLFRADIIYNYDGGTNTVQSLRLERLFATMSTNVGEIVLISADQNNIVCYDVDNVIQGQSDFIYFTATQSFSDVKTIARRPNGRDVYIGGDKIYKFDFSQFLNFGATFNNSIGTFSYVADYYANKLSLTNDNVYLAGNNSNLRFAGYTNSVFNLLDPTFANKFKSKLLFLDYDIASKLNFFTDDGIYRLANPISVTFSVGDNLLLTNVSNERNWINYYQDSIKTFRYYSSMNDANRIFFSTHFRFATNTILQFTNQSITTDLSFILPLAPNINNPILSRYIAGATPIVTPNAATRYSVFLSKWLIIFQTDMRVGEGDVLRLESDIIDVNLIVNRIEQFSGLSSQKLVYCFTDFNENIIRNIVANTRIMTVTNLNRYGNIDQLIERFEKHIISYGYKLEKDGSKLKISQRFNSKTAYYNMRTSVNVNSQSYIMDYEESFLDFGYSPTYNILDYLNKINPSEFNGSSAFSIMPRYFNMPGNNGNSFTQSNIYIDLEEGLVVGTVSYVRTGTNKIIFGEDFKFHWESLLLNTFIDLDMNSQIHGLVTNERMLIANKYIDVETGGYAIEFHKKIELPPTIPVNFFDVSFFNFRSRNTLQQISDDLQLLNNIQRTTSQRSVETLVRFTNLENELYKKFSTDSYFKVLASDYRIRRRLTAIIYTDYKYELAMNIINLEQEKKYSVSNMIPIQGYAGFSNPKVRLEISSEHEVEAGDLIYIELTGGSFSSQFLNPQYAGLHTVLETFSMQGYGFIITSLDYSQFSPAIDTATISIIKSDPFLNYLPVDLIDLGLDLKVKRAIAIEPENIRLSSNKYYLEDLDLNRYRYELMDGLSLQEISDFYPWLLEAEIDGAIIGRDKNGIVWYSGDWLCGRWFGGTWYSGRWIFGDWYGGEWYSFNTIDRIISIQVDKSYSDPNLSKWYNGRWFDGTWYDGKWYNGRRYAGDWYNGSWFNGIWNDGNWLDGVFSGGVWILGTWRDGIFNCDGKPSYWLDGKFEAGDFENGIWYNGQFGNTNGRLTRFGTRSSASRPSLWHSGKWIDGEFYSKRTVDDQTGEVILSDIHRWSEWRTGIWFKGSFWGGIVYNMDFRSGTWYGGILEEIQVIGIDRILPAAQSNNAIVLNGDFRFNIGDEIWIIDDDRNVGFSPLGNNTTPRKYRINKIEELDNKKTKVFLNYNLSSLRVDSALASATYSNVETGLRVVSNFKGATWKSGIWTNGIFDGNFEAGIWFNGLFSGTWGI